MYKTQQIRLTSAIPDNVRGVLILMCEHASSLANCTIFEIRQKHFESCERNEFFDRDGFFRSEFKMSKVKSASYPVVWEALKDNHHYKLLGGQQAQQTIKSVIEAFTSYNKLLPLFFKGELNGKPKMPNYRKNGGLSTVTIPAQALRRSVQKPKTLFLPAPCGLYDKFLRDFQIKKYPTFSCGTGVPARPVLVTL